MEVADLQVQAANPRHPSFDTMLTAVLPDQDHAVANALPVLRAGTGFDMLSGVRVLDLTTSVAGPYGAMLLGDLGADIIKIERPGTGDDARAWGPPFLDGESLWFLSVNRNKRSVTLNLNEADGQAILRDLVSRCDVVIVNQLPRVLKKLGLDADSLHAVKPDLIHVAITGFGLTGARSDWACYDLIAEGYSGVMDLTGAADGPAQKVGAPAADMLAGQDAALAVVAALFQRGRTGVGRSIDVSLVDSMTRFLSARIVPAMASGESPRRSGGRDSVIAIYQTFETADEPITLGLGNDAIWRRFWTVLGQPSVAEDPRYETNALRRRYRAPIVKHIQDVLFDRGCAEWLALFQAARIPAGPINRVDQVVADPHLQARGLFFTLEAEGRRVPQVGTGFLIDGAVNRPRSAPPRLGQHTREVLEGLLGYDNNKILALDAKGII